LPPDASDKSTAHLASRFLRDDLADVQPYHVEPHPHRVKLDANESPYDAPPDIKAETSSAFADISWNRYPDPHATRLREGLAARVGVPADHLAIGNGSDEIIGALIHALGRPDTRVVSPEPSFSMYGILARGAGVDYRGAPLTAEFELDVDAVRDAMRPDGLNIVFLSYPNNPTGACWDRDAIANLLEMPDVLLVVDEAYYEYSGKTFLAELDGHRNLIVLRTFSKAFGLASLRIGFMVADPEWVACVDKVRLPYNVNAMSQVAALTMLDHDDRVAEHLRWVMEERDRVLAAMEEADGIELFRTDANFVLFRAAEGAQVVFDRLLDAGVLIRNLDRPGLLRDCLRVTIGTPAENTAFLGALMAEPDDE
jgi:histidinol-phosphate aminotransferase